MKKIAIILLIFSSVICLGFTHSIQSFNTGQTSPLMEARSDLSKYFSACRTIENMLVTVYGPVTKRPGTKYIATAKENSPRLITFEYSVDDVYVIEMGDNYMRFYRSGGQILDANDDVYEISTTYNSNDLFNIKYAQSNNEMRLVDGNNPVQALIRYSHASWSIEDVNFTTGPFQDEQSSPTFNYSDDQCTGGTPSVASFTGGSAANLFDDADAFWEDASSPYPGWAKYDFGVGVTKIIQKYTLQAYDGTRMPKDWQLQGSNNDSTWANLDSRAGETGWATTEKRTYTFNNSTAYRYYRIYMTAGNNPSIARISEIEMMEKNTSSIAIKAAATTGSGISITATGNIFYAGHVGSLWRIKYSSDPNVNGIIKIVSYVDPNEVTADILQPLEDTNDNYLWSEGYWSDYRGWPNALAFYQQRTVYGGSTSFPQILWFSKTYTDTFDDFNEGDLDTDAFTMALTGQNPIQWILPQDYLIIGTSGSCGKYGEQGKAITLTSPSYQEQSKNGSSSINALVAGNSVLYVERGDRKIREFLYSLQYDHYVSYDLTVFADNITESEIKDIAFQQNPYPLLWCVLNNGEIALLTFQKDQEVIAWTKIITDGDFESVVVVPSSSGEDEVWVSVLRTIDGNDVSYIEQFQPINWGSDANDCWFVDSGLSYSGVATDSFSGLDHLIGENVYVYGDGVIEPNEVVDPNGELTIDRAASNVIIGLPFTSKMETLPLVIDPQDKAMNKKITSIDFDLYKTGYMKYGNGRYSTLTNLRFNNDMNIDPNAVAQDLYTSLNSPKHCMWPYGSMKKQTVYIESDKPMPLTIREITPNLDIYP